LSAGITGMHHHAHLDFLKNKSDFRCLVEIVNDVSSAYHQSVYSISGSLSEISWSKNMTIKMDGIGEHHSE
jgi:hypothetical protein